MEAGEANTHLHSHTKTPSSIKNVSVYKGTSCTAKETHSCVLKTATYR